MDCVNNLIAFGLRQVIGDYADTVMEVADPAAKIIAVVRRRFTDHSKALPVALQRANDRAWQTLAIALAGDDWLTSLKLWVTANGDQRGFREEVTQLLKEMPLPFEQSPIRFRKACLSELKRARAQKHLSAEAINPNTIAHCAAGFRRYADTPCLIEGAAQSVDQVAEQLAPHYKNLALLLRLRPPAGGPPLLAAAFLYFLRREIATNAELARELTFESLRELSKGQDQLFGLLEESLGHLGKSVDAILEIVLGIREELAQLRDEIRELAQRNAIPAHRLTRRVAVTIKSGNDQALLKKLWAAYSKLPAAAHDADDLLLLGDTLEAAALFQEAEACYSAAALAAQAKNQEKEAEALYKGYREACQLEQWDIALQRLLRAAKLQPERYEPFDLRKYEPVRILGSGGFGTVILCCDRHGRKRQVAIKILFAADLEREINELFNEAQILYDLQHSEYKHSAIIGVQHWNFAGNDETRPYIVMDYFEGETLRSYLEKHKKLSHADLIEVARQVAEGMRAAHGQDLLHRDLKPDNILIRRDEEGRWTVRIIDFGLAVKQEMVRTSVVNEVGQRTREDNSFAGSYKYSSPEQRRELKDVMVSKRSDIHSWGKTFSEALLGDGVTELKSWDVSEMPSEMQPLGQLLERCTAALPHHRPEHFDEVVAVLARLRENRIHTKNTGPDDEKKHLEPCAENQHQTEIGQAKQLCQPKIASCSLGTFQSAGFLGFGAKTVEPFMSFAFVPKGTFWMGGGFGTCGDRQVAIEHDFYFGVYPVTQEEWQAVMGTNPSYFRKGERLPVERVSWIDCQRFIQRMNDSRKDKTWLYRLPREAEWEYACRGAATTKEDCSWNYYLESPSNTLSGQQANFADSAIGRTTKVGSYPPNVLGIHDLHGNVWEWCEDTDGSSRVIRGGGWGGSADHCRAACRGKYAPTGSGRLLGFRLVRVPVR